MFPTDPTVLAGFITTAVAIIISPGPDTIVILRHAVNGGRRDGLAAVTGVQLGLVVHTTLAVAGISVVICSSPLLFRGIAVIGTAGFLTFSLLDRLQFPPHLNFDEPEKLSCVRQGVTNRPFGDG